MVPRQPTFVTSGLLVWNGRMASAELLPGANTDAIDSGGHGTDKTEHNGEAARFNRSVPRPPGAIVSVFPPATGRLPARSPAPTFPP